MKNCPMKELCYARFSNGTCDNCVIDKTINKKDKAIARLTAENAELRARLDRAVELPCKVGDKVYWVEDDPNIPGICEFTVQGFSFRTNNNDGLRVIIGTFLEPCVDYYKNKQLFFDRTEAEARLAELKGGEGK